MANANTPRPIMVAIGVKKLAGILILANEVSRVATNAAVPAAMVIGTLNFSQCNHAAIVATIEGMIKLCAPSIPIGIITPFDAANK